jgi:restriction endonuclease Mrr
VLWIVTVGGWLWAVIALVRAAFGPEATTAGVWTGLLTLPIPMVAVWHWYPPYRQQERSRVRARKIADAVLALARARWEAALATISRELQQMQVARLDTLKTLQALGGYRFEILMARIFSQLGYSTHRTRGSGDGGVDIHAYRKNEHIVIQCKNSVAPVGPGPVRDLYGVMAAANVTRGILVCTSMFSDAARAFGEGRGIEFIDGDQVLAMMRQSEITLDHSAPRR